MVQPRWFGFSGSVTLMGSFSREVLEMSRQALQDVTGTSSAEVSWSEVSSLLSMLVVKVFPAHDHSEMGGKMSRRVCRMPGA